MYGKNKNLYITYNSVRNINNDTQKTKIQYNIIYNIYNILQNLKKKKILNNNNNNIILNLSFM